jgi:hypothetical protein
MKPRWWSQPFAPEGSAAAEGIVNQLGRPSLDPLTILIREAAQNSWDARNPIGAVDFRVEIRALGEQSRVWQRVLLPAPHQDSNVHLLDVLTPSTVVLIISDRNTVGLGGPIRAGTRSADEASADFVQFLRNVGEPSDHEFGGGTYGFGKGIFYQLSRAGVILVDTKTAVAEPAGRRLMGAALERSWYLGERRYTGRHWWGDVAEDDVPDPVMGDDADALAAEMGLPGFGDGRTGTDVVVLGADLGTTGVEPDVRPRTPHEAATFLASAVLWNLWPKFIPDQEGRYMRFFVGTQGNVRPVLSPTELEEFDPFVESLRAVRSGTGTPYSRTVPPKNAGSLAVSLAGAQGDVTRQLVGAARPFDGPTRHIARMRVAELVVDYLPGPVHPDSRLSYGGVFKASEEADQAFAAAEPPTHDDWVTKGLTGSVRGVVQNARTFILKRLDESFGGPVQVSGSGGQGLGELAARLASLVPALAGSGASGDALLSGRGLPVPGPGPGGSSWEGSAGSAGGQKEGSSSTATRRGSGPRIVVGPLLRVVDGQVFLAARIRIPAAPNSRRIQAAVTVVLEGGGAEAEVPAGSEVPRITQWQSADGGKVVHGADLVLSEGGDSEWWVYSTHVADAVVRFKVTQEISYGA